jgi:hypothetical protein
MPEALREREEEREEDIKKRKKKERNVGIYFLFFPFISL